MFLLNQNAASVDIRPPRSLARDHRSVIVERHREHLYRPDMAGQTTDGIERLYRDHRAPLRWFVHKIVRNAHDADEIVQQSFERFLSANTARADIANERAYLYRIASNLARNLLRNKKYEREQAPYLAVHESLLEQEAQDHSDETGERERRLVALHAAIDALPPKCRAAFVLCKLNGFTYAQAAERLGVTSHMIKKHLARGMALCTAHLDDNHGDPDDQ